MGPPVDFDQDPVAAAPPISVNDPAHAKPDPSPTVPQQAGNQAVQRNRNQAPPAPDKKNPPDAQDFTPSPLDEALTAGKSAVELLELVQSTLLPAYRRAVDAMDPIAALELARHMVGSIKLAEGGERVVQRSVPADNDYHRFLGSTPNHPDESEDAIASKFALLEIYQAQLLATLPFLQLKLAVDISPQMFHDRPVLGQYTLPQLGADPDAYLVNEAGTTVELLSVVKQIQGISGARPGTSPLLTTAQSEQIVGLIECWRSRPVNFAFLASSLTELGIWQAVGAVQGKSGKTLEQTNSAVLAQVKETGALADVGELDTESLRHLFGFDTNPMYPEFGPPTIDDDTAMKIFEKLRDAAPDARGPLIRQIKGMGELDHFCDHLPWKYVQAVHESVLPFDAEAAAMLVPFFSGKGGGESMHKIYMDKVDDRIKEGHSVRAYGWFLLDFLHNAFTAGFEHEYSEAYDARSQGWITDDQFHSAAGKALGKAAVITVASAMTGGAAGEFSEGLAAGLGASKSAAQVIGGAAGGFAGGIGGHLSGDVYDQLLSGKKGFDSFGDYMKSGALGGVIGTVTAGISVGAGKYLPSRFARPVDTFAESYPGMGKVLESIRSSGLRGGCAVRMKVADLLDLMGSGFGGPGTPGAFAHAGAYSDVRGMPLDTEVLVQMRPIRPLTDSAQMSSIGSKTIAGETGAVAQAPHAETGGPFVEIEKVEVAEPDPATQVSTGKSVVEDESVQASVMEPETGVSDLKPQPDAPSAAGSAPAEQIQRLQAESEQLSTQAKVEEPRVKAAKNKLAAAERKVSNLSDDIIGRRKYDKAVFERNPHLKEELDQANIRLEAAKTERAQAEKEYVAVKSQQDLRYHQIRENRAEVQRLSRPELELSPTERGRVNELRVLKEEGLLGTKRPFTVRDPKTREFETTIPDGVRENGRTVDVKDVAELSETQQLRLQRVVSEMHGQKPEIITGNNTKVPPDMRLHYLIRQRPDLGPQR